MCVINAARKELPGFWEVSIWRCGDGVTRERWLECRWASMSHTSSSASSGAAAAASVASAHMCVCVCVWDYYWTLLSTYIVWSAYEVRTCVVSSRATRANDLDKHSDNETCTHARTRLPIWRVRGNHTDYDRRTQFSCLPSTSPPENAGQQHVSAQVEPNNAQCPSDRTKYILIFARARLIYRNVCTRAHAHTRSDINTVTRISWELWVVQWCAQRNVCDISIRTVQYINTSNTWRLQCYTISAFRSRIFNK